MLEVTHQRYNLPRPERLHMAAGIVPESLF